MKTDTRARIVKIVKQQGAVRPVELVKVLGITPQAIHRHLKALVTSGELEKRGRGPLTHYHIAGAASLDRARRWCGSIAAPTANPAEVVCETRDVLMARLNGLSSFSGEGFDQDALPLVISVAGELGNNCFDHNLGSWRDVPGCWFECQSTGGRLWVCIADRGQGVFRSLLRADPTLADEQTALVTAFEKTLSGRAPENRGNGLKFVRNIIVADNRRGLACRSGAGLVAYGELGPECREELARFASEPGGTVTLVLWSLK